MSTTYLQPGHTLTITAPAAVASDDVVIVGDIVGIAQGDAASGAPVDVTVTGCWELPKVSADDVQTGEALFWDATAGLATVVSTGNTAIGYAIADAPAATGTVAVRLPG
ncbi:DUF2190 family protein [Paracoccus methylarcula]|uniref:DUF2190 domain-containing protein n=1 Tax=Paracoccus methylarcula TaxID=72022 RepID=A0A3R7LNU7_9RHOB|nr:DUF2190 family protein [Paracoccus methylarcula]RNF33716.1 DUF2190 domain-containing protein [Paracoccus methylarcula]